MGVLGALLRVAAAYYLHDPKPPTTAQPSGRRGVWIQAVIHLEGKPPSLPPPARALVPPVNNRELAARGYSLALMFRSEEATDLAGELGGVGIAGSVTEEADLHALVDKTLDAYGRVDAVVNSTGHPSTGDILDITVEEWHAGLRPRAAQRR
jgi:hypothetical protein